MEYVGTHNTKYVRRFGRARVVNPLSCGTVVKTLDQQLIYGCRRGLGPKMEKYGLPAGFVDPDSDRDYSRVDPFLTMQRELQEEIGILRSEILRMQCLGLLGGEGTHLVFLTEVASISDDIKDRFRRGTEFERLESIGIESVAKFLEVNHDRMSQHSLGAIALCNAYFRDLL
jgi:8-oxo-dGTP pyrophosphatase MutT (NUDIX family)